MPFSDGRILLALLLWSGSASRLQAQYDPAAPEPMAKLRGALVLHGGGPVSDDVRTKFVELAGGTKGRLVIVTPDRVEQDDFPWADAGPASATTVELPHFDAAALREATGVWLERVAPMAIGPDGAAALRAVIERGGVVGGTSAGAALAELMLAGEGERQPGLNLLPRVVVAPTYSEEQCRDRLLQTLSAHAGRVGFGIPDQTALVVRGRSLQVVGAAPVVVALASSMQRPVRYETLSAGQTADLIALSRAAQARDRPPFPQSEPPSPVVEQGTLIIVGGGGLPAGLVPRFIELAGGPDAPLVVVPCTEQEVVLSDGFVETLRKAGAQDVTLVHTKDRRKAREDDEFLAPLKRARGVWFGGGRQWNLVDSYQHTTAHKLMHDVLARGGVIGGSSAGASIQGDYMPRGNPLGNRDMLAEGYEQGLGFLTGVAIDQHFQQRNRFADMTSLMEAHPQLLGIGIDEATALIVRGSVAEIVGKGNVAFYDTRRQDTDDDKDYLSIGAGRQFDLKARRVLEPLSE